MPQKFWANAFQTIVFLINSLPSPIIQNQSPYFRLFHKQPDYSFLRVFGSACYPHLRPYNHHKMDLCSSLCVFIGYSSHHMGYLCLHLPTDHLYISKNVVFDEQVFPFRSSIFVASDPVSSPSHGQLPLSLAIPQPSFHLFLSFCCVSIYWVSCLFSCFLCPSWASSCSLLIILVRLIWLPISCCMLTPNMSMLTIILYVIGLPPSLSLCPFSLARISLRMFLLNLCLFSGFQYFGRASLSFLSSLAYRGMLKQHYLKILPQCHAPQPNESHTPERH